MRRGEVRLVVTLVEASASEGAAPLAEAVLEDVTRIRPPRLYVLDYDPAFIDASGSYLVVARMEDAEAGELLGTGGDPIRVITAGAPVVGIDIRLVEAPGAP